MLLCDLHYDTKLVKSHKLGLTICKLTIPISKQPDVDVDLR